MYALEQRWDDFDRIVALMGDDRNFIARLRGCVWRGDRASAPALREELSRRRAQFRDVFDALLAIACGSSWADVRDNVRAHVHTSYASRRSAAFSAQLIAEAAGLGGDLELQIEALRLATDYGLFDLHWLDRCVLLAAVRADARYAELRAPVARRADAVFDALYGDHPVQVPDRTRVERPTRLDVPARTR